MAIINLLPSSKRRKVRRGSAKAKVNPSALLTSVQLSPLILKIGSVCSLLSFLLCLFCFFQLKSKERNLLSLERKTSALKAEHKKIEEMKTTKMKLEKTLSFYQERVKKKIKWKEKLCFINEVIPKEIWLTFLLAKDSPEKTILIKGSSVSLIEAQIINSISQFAQRLSENKDFKEVKLGTVVAGKSKRLNVMNFNIECRLR